MSRSFTISETISSSLKLGQEDPSESTKEVVHHAALHSILLKTEACVVDHSDLAETSVFDQILFCTGSYVPHPIVEELHQVGI